MLKYCPDKLTPKKMCDKAIDACLPALNLVPLWFFRSKMIKKLHDDLFSNDDVILVNIDSNYVTLFSDEMGILSVDINNSSFDDVNFDKDDPETTIQVRLMAWCNRYKKCSSWKKDISK